jgi:UDP-N-acetylmuramate--alanine ligase
MAVKKIHFIGVGGAGMAPQAAICLQLGIQVSGSDREDSEKLRKLARDGAKVFIGHRAENLPGDTDLVVYSSAIPVKNPERERAEKLQIPQLCRGEFLARIATRYSNPVAISGSHGKSSITAMLVHILKKAGGNPGYMIGAELTGDLPPSDAGRGNRIFITEADESDATHTLLHPALGIVPNVESDHAWSVGGEAALYNNFKTFAKNSKTLIYMASPRTDILFACHPNSVRVENGGENDRFGRWFGFQAWNARLAVEAAVEQGVTRKKAMALLDDFKGVSRRLTVWKESPEQTVIEDYAHHPTEVKNSINWLKTTYKDRKLHVVFQPHRYARLQMYIDELAEALRPADKVYVVPVFAAWSENGPVNSTHLAEKIGEHAVAVSADFPALAAELKQNAPEVIAVIGAGDINALLHLL